jgi:hypothetical protein
MSPSTPYDKKPEVLKRAEEEEADAMQRELVCVCVFDHSAGRVTDIRAQVGKPALFTEKP